jgi:hypothetical protein
MRKRACDWCARRLRHLPATFSRHFANLIHAYRGDSGALLPLVECQVQLCRENGMAFYLVLSEIYFGWAYANAVDPEAGLARIRAAIEEFKAMGVSTAMPFFCSLLAHAEMAAKHEEQAVFEIDAAIAIAHVGRPTAMIPRRTGYAAKSCSDAIRPIRRRRRKRSVPLATSLRNRAREALDCSPRCRLPNSAIRALASPRPRPSSHPRLRASRRLRKCPRSPRRWRFCRPLTNGHKLNPAVRTDTANDDYARVGPPELRRRSYEGHGRPRWVSLGCRTTSSRR